MNGTASKIREPNMARLWWLALLLLCAGGLQAQDEVRARFIHLAADHGALDIYINGELALANIEYASASSFVRIPASQTALSATPAGLAPTAFDGEIALNTDATILLAGAPPFQTAPADLSRLDFPIARLQVVNALSDGAAFDLVADDGAILAEDLASGDSSPFMELDAARLDLALKTSDAGETLLEFPLGLPAGALSTVVVHGDAASPQFIHAIAAADQGEGDGGIRFLHAGQGAAPLDINVDGALVVPGLAFAAPTPHLAIPAGARQLSLSLAGTKLLSADLEVKAGQMQTVMALGSPAALTIESYADDLPIPDAAGAVLSLVNAMPNGSVQLARLDNGAVFQPNIGFAELGGPVEVWSGPASLALSLDIDGEEGEIAGPGLYIFGGSHYLLVVLEGNAFTPPRALVMEAYRERQIQSIFPGHPMRPASAAEPPETESATETETPPETDQPAEFRPRSPYGIVILDPGGRLHMRQYPSAQALSLGLIPPEARLIVLGRRGPSSFDEGEESDMPIDLSEYTEDPALVLDLTEDLEARETWLFASYLTPDGGLLNGWVNAHYLRLYSRHGNYQRRASLPLTPQNQPGGAHGTAMQPPELAESISARVYRLEAGAMLNLRAGNHAQSEVLAQLPQGALLKLAGFDADEDWAYVEHPEADKLRRGWVSAAYIQVLLKGEPALLASLRALDDTALPVISGSVPGEVRSLVDVADEPPASPTALPGISGEVALNPGAKLHLRAAPRADALSLELIPAGAMVAIDGVTEDGQWLRARYAEKDGWVAAHYLRLLLRGRLYNRDYVRSLLNVYDALGVLTLDRRAPG